MSHQLSILLSKNYCENLSVEVGQRLDAQQQNKLYALLLGYADVFALNDKQLGRTDRLKHTIDTKGSHPIYQQARRISPFKREEVHQLLSDMLSRDIIQPSTSPWAFSIVFVKNKDSSPFLH